MLSILSNNLVRVLLLAAIAIGLRFYKLDAQSFWLDEALTISHISVGTIPELFNRLIYQNVHPPLYYVLLKQWTSLFGVSEIGVRSFSALCSCMLWGAIGWIALLIGGSSLRLVALGVSAPALYQIWFAQEAKGYALSMLLTALSVGLVLSQMRGPRVWKLVLLTVSETLLFFTHYMNGLFFAVHGVFVLGLLFQRARESAKFRGLVEILVRTSAPSLFIAGTISSVFYLSFREAISAGADTLWFPVPTLRDFVELYARFLTYDLPWSRQSHPLELQVLALTALLALVVFVGGKLQSSKTDSSVVFILLWAFLLPALSWTCAQLGLRGFYFRTLACAAPALLILLAWIICQLRVFPLQAAFFSIAVHLSTSLYPFYFGIHHKENWRGAAELVGQHFDETTPIVFTEPGARVPFDYYFQRNYTLLGWSAFQQQTDWPQQFWLLHAVSPLRIRSLMEEAKARGYRVTAKEDLAGMKLRKLEKTHSTSRQSTFSENVD